jgi:glutathione S-transferase
VAGNVLYGIPASHPSIAAELMLARKGIGYRRIDLLPVVSRPLLRALRFPGTSVPALRLDGRRIQGSRQISRGLDDARPAPALFPADPERRRRVEDAERWGDEVLQQAARRIELWCVFREPSGVRVQLQDAHFPFPFPARLGAIAAKPVLWVDMRIFGVTDEAVRRDLAELPSMLDRVDGWIADGLLGGDEPNAADFQIAPSLRLMTTIEDLRPAIESRPAGELARRLVPTYPNRVQAGRLPREWLAPLGTVTTAV